MLQFDCYLAHAYRTKHHESESEHIVIGNECVLLETLSVVYASQHRTLDQWIGTLGLSSILVLYVKYYQASACICKAARRKDVRYIGQEIQ
jgi:hypothetical protein